MVKDRIMEVEECRRGAVKATVLQSSASGSQSDQSSRSSPGGEYARICKPSVGSLACRGAGGDTRTGQGVLCAGRSLTGACVFTRRHNRGRQDDLAGRTNRVARI